MGALTHNGEVLQGLPADASQINFDKTGTNLNSTQTENAIKEVNTKANTLQSEKADTDMVAADFNAGTSYTAGNYCVQDGKLYKFKVNHSGAWSAADVDEIKIAGELASLKSGLTSVDISSTMTFETGITVYKSVIRKVASMVVFSFQLGVPLSASFIIIGTITGNRPQSDIVFSGMAYTGTDGEELPCMLNVDPAGQFILSRTNSKEYVVVSGSYAV